MNKKKQQITFLVISILIACLPNIIFAIIGEDIIISSISKKLVFILFSSSFIVFFLAFLKPKTFMLLNLVLCPLLIISTFHVVQFKVPISQAFISSIFLTNYLEIKELLGANLFGIILGVSVIILYAFIIYKTPSNFRLSAKFRLIIFSLCSLVILSVYGRDYFKISNNDYNDTTSNKSSETAGSRFLIKLLKTYPIDGFIKLARSKTEINKLKNYQDTIANFKFNATKDLINDTEIYVMVIGETARKHNFGIYGYNRNTSPTLDTISNLLAFDNVYSSSNITSHSIPHILTRATPNNDDIKFTEPAIHNMFKEVGFKTYSISNVPVGVGSVFGMYYSLADENINLSISGVEIYDEEIIKMLDRILIDKTYTKKFIIIHTLGSHFSYSSRYPELFNVFKPSIRKNAYESSAIEKKEEIINSYDNSILYTDYVLGKIISHLKKQKAVSSMFYISDHGENLYDDSNEYFLHAYENPTKYEFEIPLFIWTSNEYNNLYKTKHQILKENISKRISTINSFHTVLDMANITYKNEQLQKSFANKAFDSIQKRYLLTPNQKVIQLD